LRAALRLHCEDPCRFPSRRSPNNLPRPTAHPAVPRIRPPACLRRRTVHSTLNCPGSLVSASHIDSDAPILGFAFARRGISIRFQMPSGHALTHKAPYIPASLRAALTAHTHSRDIRRNPQSRVKHLSVHSPQTTPALILSRQMQRPRNVLAPHARRESITVLFASFNRFLGVGNVSPPSNGPKTSCCATLDVGCTHCSTASADKKNHALAAPVFGPAQQVAPRGRPGPHLFDAVQLHPRYDRLRCRRLVERCPARCYACSFIANLRHQRSAMLSASAAATRAADLPLVEPDSIDQAFNRDCRIESSKIMNGDFAAQVQGKLLWLAAVATRIVAPQLLFDTVTAILSVDASGCLFTSADSPVVRSDLYGCQVTRG